MQERVNQLLRWAAMACVSLAMVGGCAPPETKLSENEVKNFKGSRDMSAEAQQKMQEGLDRMAKFNEELAKKRANQPPPSNPAPTR